MRKLLTVWIVLAALTLATLWPAPASAQFATLGAQGCGGASCAPPPGCADANVIAWKAAVITAGGTVSAGQETNVCTLVGSLKSHGSWALLDRLWLFASENTQQALIDIKNLGAATAIGAPTFTPSQGYTGASGKYLESNFAGSVDGVNFIRNDNGFTAYIMNNRTSGIGGATLGYYDSVSTGSQSFLNPITTGPLVQYDMNNLGFNVNGGAPTTGRGVPHGCPNGGQCARSLQEQQRNSDCDQHRSVHGACCAGNFTSLPGTTPTPLTSPARIRRASSPFTQGSVARPMLRNSSSI